MRYRPGRDFAVPALNFEPGRIRLDAFFAAMYGGTRDEVAAHVEDVQWMLASGGKTVRVTA